jgi:DNA-binding Lrp family transcriptional regulator
MSDVVDELDYTGLHAFVFIREVDPGANIRAVIEAVRGFGPPRVRFAAEVVGSYLGFAHVRTETLAEMHDLIAGDLWDRGVHCSHNIEKDVARQGERLVGAKRSTPEVIALSRVRTRTGALYDVLDTMAAEHGPLRRTFRGASVVFGDFDILLQLGAASYEEVADDAANALQSIDGIVGTDTAFIDGSRYEG